MGRSRMSVVKRQRELKKAEKAAQKRAKRHSTPLPVFTEPKPNVRLTPEGKIVSKTTEGNSDDETPGQ